MAAKNNDSMTVHWWALTIRGIAAILFGVAAIFWPGLTLVTLVYLLGAFVLVSGVLNVVVGTMSIDKGGSSWALTLVLGLAELAVGVYLVRHPAVTFATFILVAGLLFVAHGVIEVVAALMESASATSKMLTILAGVASFLVGILLFFQPAASGIAFVWILGVFALITGPLLIAISLDIKKMAE
jgi:uncharacterized membrane protein HdeD (DUF308 family)